MASESEMIIEGKKRYKAGIERIGGTAKYFECGGHGGMKTATCLKAAKVKAGSSETWAANWAKAMGGI